MDDGRFSRQAGVPLSLPIPHGGPINNKWRTAIADGAFDDDDAIQVAGMENIADGQLARMHRASKFASAVVTAGYDDQRLRRGQSGQTDPRAQFPRSQRGPSVAGQAHQGDGPVQVPGKLSYSRRAPAPPGMDRRHSITSVSPGAHAARRGPAPPGFGRRPGNATVSATTHGGSPLQPSRSEPSAVQVQKFSPRDQQQPEAIRLVLPEGASIVFQVHAELASPAFLDKNAKFPGIVYLIAGRDPSDNQIILRVDNEGIEDVKHSPREYGNLMMQSQEVILQFRTANSRNTWYVVKFRQRDDMFAFVDELRNFVDHPDRALQASSTAAVIDQGHIGAGESAIMNAAPQATVPDSLAVSSSANESSLCDSSSTVHLSTSLAVHPPQLPQPIEPPTSVQPRAGQNVIVSSQQQDTVTAVPANLVEDIVTWVINILTSLRETGPAEMARFDVLPCLFRGTALAVLSRHSGFGKLDRQQRTAYIDEHCIPRVFEMFKHRIRGHAAQNQSAQPVQTTKPQDQITQEVRASTPSTPRRIVYTAEELIELRSIAKSPPHWLTELGFLREAAPSVNQRTMTPGLPWDEAHDAPMPDYKSQIQQVVAANVEWPHNGRAPESSPFSPPKKGELIGLFVTNTKTDAEALEILAEEDQPNIIRVVQWGPMNRVLKFKTTEDRDAALQRISDEFRTRSQNRSKPFVEVFQSRERRDTGSTIRSAPSTGRTRGSCRSPSPMRSLPTRTSQAGVSVTATPARAANVDNHMAVGGFEARNPQETYGLDGHCTQACGPMSPGNDTGTTSGQLISSLTPQAPAITVTAPAEQGNADGVSCASENSMKWSTEPQGSSDAMEIDTEEPSSSVLDGHCGLNASMFNSDRIDLLGETSGSWTGALAKNKSYMEDLMSIL